MRHLQQQQQLQLLLHHLQQFHMPDLRIVKMEVQPQLPEQVLRAVHIVLQQV